MTLKTIDAQYYGDETRWFVGVVESVNDPLKQGRVRVRIFGVHSANISDIPASALPWAQVVAPITQAGTSGVNGTPVGLKASAQVFGMFLDGKHSQIPLVIGSIPKVDGPAPNPHHTGWSGVARPGQPPILTGDALHNSGGRSVAAMTFKGGSNPEKVYNVLEEGFRIDMGLKNSRELAAGFVGNFMSESGSNLNYLVHNTSGKAPGALGIAQWRGNRYHNLMKYAAGEGAALEDATTLGGTKTGTKIPSLKIQAAFVLHEISGGDGYETSNFNREIRTQPTAKLAGSAVEAWYERHQTALRNKPFETRYRNFDIKKRVDDAQRIYSSFAHRNRQGAQ